MTHDAPPPVLVTGGTGRVGRLVVDQLLEAGVPVRVLTRRPGAADLPPAVDVVEGDFTAPESLDAALEDVAAVFFVWTLPFAAAPAVVERFARHSCRVVFLSAPHRTQHPFFQQPNPMAKLHADMEELLLNSGVSMTVIRPGMFASNALFWWAPAIRSSNTVRWPYGAAETAPVDDRDVAEVGARVLYDDSHAGGDYVLTGPRSVSQADQVRIISTVIGRDVALEEVSAEEFRRETADTWPPAAVDMLLRAWAATMGQPAFVTAAVQEILRRPARTFEQWASDHADAFR